MRLPLSRLLLVILATAPVLVTADEGMWTVDNFPAAAVKQKFGVEITPQWLEKVRLSTVRISGCTASFVSPDGLLLTNHHCVQDCLAQLSSKDRDLHENGFLANEREQELRCPAQRADILVGVEDITAKVVAATAGKDDKSAGEIRKKTLTQLEQACEQAAGESDPRRCESVKLYQGGQYFLYKYRRFDDVRLVFAPEEDIAFFGGDPDNFQFPRWSLDMSLLRVYDGGKPVQWPHYLPIRWQGAAEGEAVFVSGHPGTTERLLTVAQLDAQRKQLPLDLLWGSELRGRYIQFAQGDAESARIVLDRLQGLENGIKVRRKQLDALLDGPLMEQKAKDEAALRARAGLAGAQDPWEQITRAERINSEIRLPYEFLEQRGGFGGGYSSLYGYAVTLVRGTAEKAKPNEERLREYTDSALPLVERRLLANVPFYAEPEKIALSLGLMRLREYLGPDHPLVVKLMRTISPEALADSVVSGSRLGDAAYRKQLWEGGAAAVAASQDPMIRLAAEVDPDARAVRKRYEDEVESPVDVAAERIAAARFAAYGTGVYPDATFTLRVNDGSVQGWMDGSRAVPPFTYLEQAFERSTGAEPFRLPEGWMLAKGRLDPKTPFNLSTNNDIVGGNSGSPLINARGELVGLVFDGNIHSISGTYWFNAAQNRAVAVHPASIKAALTEVYGAREIAAELGLKWPAQPAGDGAVDAPPARQ